MRLKTKFQDEDFDLGEVVEANVYHGGSGRIKVIAEPTKGGMITFYFETLKGMNEMFEDAPEEPKEYWHIFGTNITKTQECLDELYDKRNKEIGNYFDSREEAEKAVEKLKAWKRLKDDGITYSLDEGDGTPYIIIHSKEEKGPVQKVLRVLEDLTLLFGGEE